MENGMNNNIQNGDLGNGANVNMQPVNNVPVNDVPTSEVSTGNVQINSEINNVNAEVPPVNSVPVSNVIASDVQSSTDANVVNNVLQPGGNTWNRTSLNNSAVADVNTPVSDAPVGNTGEKSNKKINKPLIAAMIVLLVVIGGLFGYKFYMHSPINLYKAAIEQGYKKFSATLKELSESETFNIEEESILLDGSLKLSSNLSEFEDYTKYAYDFKLGLDVKNKKMELGASMDEGSKEIIEAIIYVIDQTMYINSKQIYSKPIYQNLDEDVFASFMQEDSEKLTYDYEDIDLLVKKLSEHLSASLNKKSFKKESATISVDGKDVKVTKVIYPINQDTAYDLSTKMIDRIKKDDELIEVVAKIAGYEVADIKSMLDEVTFAKEDFVMEEEAELFLYTKGFFDKVIGLGMADSSTTISYADNGDCSELTITSEGSSFVAVTKNGKTNGTFIIDGDELLTFTFSAEEKDDNSKFDLTVIVNNGGEKLTFSLTGDATEISDKKAETSFEAKFSMTQSGETIEFGANVELNAEIGATGIADFDESDAVDYNKLTEKQKEKMLTNLEDALEGTFLYDVLFPEYDYDDDYYYSYDDYDYSDI